MSLFSKLDKSMLSLDLDRPNNKPAAAMQPTTQFTIDPALLHAAVPAIRERANAMLDVGIRPGSFYLAIDAGRRLVCLPTPEVGVAVMVFTSGFQAADYLREFKISGGVHEFPPTSLQTYMQDWKKRDVGAFALDRCPRCPTWSAFPIRETPTDEQICRIWAMHRATRIFQAQRSLRVYMDTTPANNLPDHVENRRMKRKVLEAIRDHIDCSVPYLHWMIALEAGMSHDEDVRLAAIERLSGFGPQFHDKAVLSTEGNARAVAECQVGLFRSFEMLEL